MRTARVRLFILAVAAVFTSPLFYNSNAAGIQFTTQERLTKDQAWREFQRGIESYRTESGQPIPADRLQKMEERVRRKILDPYYRKQDGMNQADLGALIEAQKSMLDMTVKRSELSHDADGFSDADKEALQPYLQKYKRLVDQLKEKNKDLADIYQEAMPWGHGHDGQDQTPWPGGQNSGGGESDCRGSGWYPGCYLRRAMERMREGDKEEALADLDAELGRNPNDAEALRARARLYSDMGRMADANADARRLLELAPADQGAMALNKLTEGRGNAESKDPSSQAQAGALALRGPAGFGRPTERMMSGLQLTSRNPLVAKALRDAQNAFAMGELSDAFAHARRALAADPNELNTYRMMAGIYRRQGNYAELLRAAEEGLRLFPKDAGLLNAQALAKSKLKDYRGAMEAANKVLAQNPNDADALANLAYAYGGLGDRARMLEFLEKAARLNPAYQASLESAQNMPAGSDIPFFFPWEAQAGGPARPYGPRQANLPGRDRRFGFLAVATIVGGFLVALGLLQAAAGPLARRFKTTFARVAGDSSADAGAAALSPTFLSPGAGLLRGQYQVLRQIGAGGMGMVYEGTDVTLSRPVAVKKMRDELRLDRRERTRFINEAKIVASLHHPNIVDIYAVIEEGDDIYLVFEFVNGKTVHDIIAGRGALGFPEALGICRGMAAALDFAHARGVIHRDLKPSNVMLSNEGFVKVMDFGIARLAKDAASRFSMTNTVAGTPPYMAPEQEQGVVRKEADVYSLAICVYQMLCGKAPFVGTGAGMLMNKVNMSYVPISNSARGLPAGIDEVFARAFQADPDRRYHTARELVAALETLALPG